MNVLAMSVVFFDKNSHTVSRKGCKNVFPKRWIGDASEKLKYWDASKCSYSEDTCDYSCRGTNHVFAGR